MHALAWLERQPKAAIPAAMLLKELANNDVLTGARSRRRFLELVEVEIARAHRFRRTFTVVHFDLDGFKGVNDRLGHSEGDAVLRAVVEVAQKTLREWPVSFSLGVLTCIDPPQDADELMHLVDGLTYAAKTGGKDTAVYDVVAARLVSVARPRPGHGAASSGPRPRGGS